MVACLFLAFLSFLLVLFAEWWKRRQNRLYRLRYLRKKREDEGEGVDRQEEEEGGRERGRSKERLGSWRDNENMNIGRGRGRIDGKERVED